ncbi:CAMK/CAMKL protein kinase [Pyricularia oryzae 70-15]|uniref:CAMK/CAMKL protein kinase n=2 Tax=Pyricularia oryzae TaxID=318829 RepID=G4MMB0_PYRO7|nr:CAMK/CAMKL protein kinase [Pyricularia oryzae 70-15]EHA56096.1 CAMK/CAMKL protein kinase [Pyricularia oryzae 70-15]
MQSARGKPDPGRKAKLANSYQALLDEFSNKELKTVGNYALGRLIGKGSFGKVYLASHKLINGSKVVLKSAKKDDSNLAREIHHHRQFVHPHIARLYEVIVTETMVWLVLEYCPGDELYNYLLKHGKLPVTKVQKTFTQLVGAVTYVHMQSCVHRDLKLENILLDKHENVKLVDFGFTREYEGKSNHLQTFCGTICYSAPEMLKGEKYAGEKVDVWSLGVILYALLCGELPFDEDDDDDTRRRILSEEPKYPDHIPPDALSLLQSLLSKRPFRRPELGEILNHPFLADHAPNQLTILQAQQPAAFSTALDKDVLQRMRSAGVNMDAVIESVLSQRCDSLAGWWTLLTEKEQRKMLRRERKRKEKEENRISRRLSTTSSRLERLATVGEEWTGSSSQFVKLGDPPPPRTRGRTERRSAHYPDLRIPDFPGLKDVNNVNAGLSPDGEIPPPPIDKDSIRSASSSRHRRPIPPPKEGVLRSARSRGSTLHLVTTSDAFGGGSSGGSVGVGEEGSQGHEGSQQKVRKKPSQVIVAHWRNWTHWIIENTRRNRHSGRRGSHSTPNLLERVGKSGNKDAKSKDASPRPQTSKYPAAANSSSQTNVSGLPKGVVANGFGSKTTASGALASPTGGTTSGPTVPPILTAPTNTYPHQRVVSGGSGSAAYKRQSLSPSPLTPRSALRRSSAGTAGLRGRKSTSSSVSSVRSMHHRHHSHSKASSTSSNGSVSTNMSKATMHATRSPHHSVKVLPATPTMTGFPSNIRLVRGGPNDAMSSGSPMQAPGSPNPFGIGSSVTFAKRKRNLFKGPMLAFGGSNGSGTRSSSAGSHSRSASANGLGRRSGEITIQEENEEDFASGNDDIEEVESFTPVIRRPGERVEEIFEEDEAGEKPEDKGNNGTEEALDNQGKEGCDLMVAQPISPISLSAPTLGDGERRDLR